MRIRGLDDLGRILIAPDDRPIFADLDDAPVFGDEYTLLDNLGYVGRDLGIAVHGEFGGRLGYALGVFNGEGADRLDVADGKSVAGRVALVPDLSAPFSLAAGFSYRETRIGEGTGFGREVGGTAYEIDAEWGAFRSPGPHVIFGSVGDNFANPETSFLGTQAWFPTSPLSPASGSGARLAPARELGRSQHRPRRRPRLPPHPRLQRLLLGPQPNHGELGRVLPRARRRRPGARLPVQGQVAF